MSLYRNAEGYSDPTAGKALENILREERRLRRRLWTMIWRYTDDRNSGTGQRDHYTGRKGLQDRTANSEAISPIPIF